MVTDTQTKQPEHERAEITQGGVLGFLIVLGGFFGGWLVFYLVGFFVVLFYPMERTFPIFSLEIV